jgi:hypothetical protein
MVSKRARDRRRRCIGLMAGVVAFLCQLLAWAWYPPAAIADTVTIPICSPDGVIYTSVPAGVSAGFGAAIKDGPAKDALAKEDSFDKGNHGCPLCPLVTGLSLPPPPAEIASAGDLSRHDSASLPGAHIAAGWFLSSLQARAPPAAA